MKLPEDRQQRLKIFIMIGLGVALVLLGIVQGIINPLRTSRTNKMARMEECRSGLELARKEIRAAARSFDERMKTLANIKAISSKYILHPILGNYLLEATGIIEAHAAALDIELEPVREVAISDIPKNSDSSEDRLLKAYTVRVNTISSYYDALRLIQAIETENPYVCITSLTIRPQTGVDLEAHNVSMEVQWPIWANPDFPTELEEQLREEASKQEAEAT